MFSKQTHKGFTMLEIFLSIAIITLLVGVGFPIYAQFQMQNDVRTATITLTQVLRRAQSLSQAMGESSQWGVRVQQGSIILFQGDSYDTRVSQNDEIYNMSPSIQPEMSPDIELDPPGEVGDIVFEKMSGDTEDIGQITLRVSDTLFSNITINEKGIINY